MPFGCQPRSCCRTRSIFHGGAPTSAASAALLAPRGASSASLAAEVGAPPWKIDRVRQQLRGWHPDGIARALHAIAEADAQVKGGGVSPEYALERAIRQIVAYRAAR